MLSARGKACSAKAEPSSGTRMERYMIVPPGRGDWLKRETRKNRQTSCRAFLRRGQRTEKVARRPFGAVPHEVRRWPNDPAPVHIRTGLCDAGVAAPFRALYSLAQSRCSESNRKGRVPCA